MHILTNVPRSKDNHAMKLGQLIEYNKRNIFVEKLCESEAGRLAPDLFLIFKKSKFEGKKVVCSLVSICFHSLQLGRQ